MRILFLSTWFPYPPDNGSKIRAYYLLRGLAQSHDVTVIAFLPPGNGVVGSEDFAALGASQVCPVPVDPYRHVRIPGAAKFISPIPIAYWPSRFMSRAVAQVAPRSGWDAVVAVQAPVAQYALQLAAVPRILDVDTSLSYQLYQRYLDSERALEHLRTFVSWQKAHLYETRLFRSFQGCTVVSETELEHLQGMLGSSDSRLELCPNGVDCQHNRPGLAPRQPRTLVYNGALTYSANYDAMRYFLDEIYPLIRQQEPGVSLTITGSLSGVNLDGLRLDESVRLSGYVKDVRNPISEAGVCAVPIRQGGGTRLKILEAMALGTPVVATTKGAEGLSVTPGENILIADEAEAFASHVVCLLRDAEFSKQVAARARQLVEQEYDWTQIGERFVALVEEVQRRQSGRMARS